MIPDPLAPPPAGQAPQGRGAGLPGFDGPDGPDGFDGFGGFGGFGALDGPGLTGELVTGEAVLLDLQPASFITRGLAIAVDLVVTVVTLFLLVLLLTATGGRIDDAAAGALDLVSVLAVMIGLPILVETLTRGRSLGKWMAGLRVVRDDGGPIRARHALIRGLLLMPEIYWSFGSVALITSLVNRRGKRLGDLLAGTDVIRERQPRRMPPVVMMPPHLAGWAHGADLAALPDPLARACRQFLARAQTLLPAARQRLGWSLAGQVGGLVAPPPPAGTHPEDFLAAVLAERRDRDYARLRHESQQLAARRRSRTSAGPLSAIGYGLPDGDQP